MNAVASVKIVPQLGCVSKDSEGIGFSKRKTVPEKPEAQSWDQFEKYDSLSLRQVK